MACRSHPAGDAGHETGRYHHRGETCDPDSVGRALYGGRRGTAAALRPSAIFPMALARRDMAVCMSAIAPDEHFVLGVLPGACAGISGRRLSAGTASKMASVVGEIISGTLRKRGETGHDIALHRLAAPWNRQPHTDPAHFAMLLMSSGEQPMLP